MGLARVAGRISRIASATEVTGKSGTYDMGIRSDHVWAFRIGDRAALYKRRSLAHFSEGDHVTAAGRDRKGTFEIAACRNDTTGALYEAPGVAVCIVSVLLILLGIPMTLVFIGLLMIPLGLLGLYLGNDMLKANRLVRSAPPPREG